MDNYNAIAIAATYGSISAVTFITGITYLQTISYSASATIYGTNVQTLMIAQSLNKTVLTWDSVNQVYNTNFSTAGAAGFTSCSGISSDGAYFIQERYSQTTILDLYTYSSGYTLTSSYDLSIHSWTLSQVKTVSIYQDNNSDYYAVVTRNSGSTFEALYLKITGTAMTLHVQPPAISLNFQSLSVSIDGSYILGYVNPNTAYYYHYDNSTNSYS